MDGVFLGATSVRASTRWGRRSSSEKQFLRRMDRLQWIFPASVPPSVRPSLRLCGRLAARRNPGRAPYGRFALRTTRTHRTTDRRCKKGRSRDFSRFCVRSSVETHGICAYKGSRMATRRRTTQKLYQCVFGRKIFYKKSLSNPRGQKIITKLKAPSSTDFK